MSAILKYVRHSVAGFVVWPKGYDEVHHAHVGRLLRGNPSLAHGNIVSAGFIEWTASRRPRCYGKSESLGIASMADDTAALCAEWGFEPPCSTCNGVGMIGGHLGQTPEQYEEFSDPCPDCNKDGAA